MSITAERLEVDVTANTSAAQRDLDSFSRRTEATARSTGRAGTAAAGMGAKFKMASGLVKAAAGTMVAAIAGKTIMAASDLNEVISKTGVVFGPQAKIVTDAAQQMADQFGISKKVYLDAASGIGLVAKASGLTKKAAAGLSTNFAALAADASSFYDVPIEDALTAMKSGLVGESEPMRQFGVLLSEAAVKTEAVRLGIAKQNAELTEGQKVQARASLITKGMADANGDLERTQTSVANRLREMKGRLTNFAADMGTKALPAAEKFLTAMLKVPSVLQKAATWGKSFLDGFITPFKPALDPIGGLLKDAASNSGAFVNALKPMGKFIQENAHGLGIAAGIITAVFIPAMVQAAITATVTKAKVVASFVAQAAASTRAAAMVGVNMVRMGVFYVQYAAVTVAQTARVIASWVAQQVAAAASAARQVASMTALAAAYAAQGARMAAAMAATVAKVVAGWVLMGVQSMLAAARIALAWVVAMGPIALVIAAVVALAVLIYKNWDSIKAATVAAWGAIAGFVGSAWEKIKSVVMAGVNRVIGFVKGNWKKIVAILLGPLGIAVGLIIANWGKIKAAFSSAIGFIKNLVSSGFNAMKGIISGAVHAYVGLWAGAWNGMKALISRVWNGIKSAVSNGISNVMSLVSGIKGKITGAFSGAAGWLSSAGNAIIDGLLGPLRAGADKVQGVLNGITDKIPDWKGPYSKDKKLLVKNGRAIIEGLNKGFADRVPAVKRYLGNLTKWVKDSFGGKTERTLVARIKATQKRVRKALEREDSITARLRAQIARRDDLKEQKSGFIDSMKSGISAQANVLNAGNTASAIRTSLEAQVGKAKAFAANLKKLAGMGYPRDLIAQVAGAGIEGGAEVAAALAAANSSDTKGIRQAFNAINSVAKSQSQALGDMLYNPGIQAANGLIEGLKKKKKSIEDTMMDIAKGMQKAIRKALGIKSPSKVMARLMAYVGAGITRGLDATRAGVAKAATRVGSVVTSGVSTALGSGPGLPGRPGGPGGLTPAATGAGTGGGNTSFTFVTNNPVAEPQSRTTNKALDRVTSLGLV